MSGFPCPSCGGHSVITDSRATALGDVPSVRRRRECEVCGARWTTWETRGQLGAIARAVEGAHEQLRRAQDVIKTLRTAAGEYDEQ